MLKEEPFLKPKRRYIDGVLLLDKPRGFSSQQALSKVKYLLRALKAGHTGTLDPLATGLLPLCFGKATKFAQGLLDADKTYLATVRLGQTTTTGDAEGEILDILPVQCTKEDVKHLLNKLIGEHLQVPPMYSALKYQGRPLYEYARKGIVIERPGRMIRIDALSILSIELPEITFSIRCSKGTYIRTVAEDIGRALGCGAHLRALRRTQVGEVLLNHAYTLEQLIEMTELEREAALLPIDALLSSFPKIGFDATLARRLMTGQRIALHDVSTQYRQDWIENSYVRVYYQHQFLGLVKYSQGVFSPYRLLANISID